MDPNNFQTNPNPQPPVQPEQVIQPQATAGDITQSSQNFNQPVNNAPSIVSAPPQTVISDMQVPGGVITPQPLVDVTSPKPVLPTQPVVGPKPKKPKFLLIIIIAVVLLAAMTVAGVLLSKPKKKSPANTAQTQQTDQKTGLSPAEAIDVEQANSSINQDISSINDENDFPPTQLDDKALGL